MIRPARSDDFDELISLFTEVAEERLWIGTEPGFDQNAYRLGWARIVDGDGGALFVPSTGESLIGTLSIHPDSEHAARSACW